MPNNVASALLAYYLKRTLGVLSVKEPPHDKNKKMNFAHCKCFLAHLSRRLIGELIVYEGIRRPSVCRRPSVNIFKRHLL